MRIFKITESIEIVCESQRTSYGFRHVATLFKDGVEEDHAKACYYNRTWERYEFESVMLSLISKNKSKALTQEEQETCKKWLDGDRTDWSGLKAVSMVAKMGDILCESQKEKNDWKARMLKAGLENKGLEIPEDFESLDEDTKQARLDAVIKIAGEH